MIPVIRLVAESWTGAKLHKAQLPYLSNHIWVIILGCVDIFVACGMIVE